MGINPIPFLGQACFSFFDSLTRRRTPTVMVHLAHRMNRTPETADRQPGWVLVEQLAHASEEPMVVVAPDGALMVSNPAMATLTGSVESAICRESLGEAHWLDAESRVAVLDALATVLAGAEPLRIGVNLVRHDRSTRRLEARMCGLGREEVLLGVLIVMRDLTNPGALEARLRLSQKTEVLGRLTTGLAHDFNNILTVVKGYSEVVLANKSLPPDVAKNIKTMATAAERGASVTRQLLTFSRRNALNFKPLDLNELITGVSQLLRRLLTEQVSLQFKFMPGLPFLMGDVGLVEQLVLNLVLHARATLATGSKLVVETGISTEPSPPRGLADSPLGGTYVCLSITDATACGPITEGRMLEECGASGLVEEHAAGLGLHVAWGVARQLAGWMVAMGPAGKETSFRVYLPAVAAVKDTAPEPAVALAPVRADASILVVEDEPSIRELAKSVLLGAGYRVMEACSASEAMAVWRAQEGRFDLLFTDIVLSDGVGGLALARGIIAERADLPVVFTTGYSVELAELGATLRRGVDFLPKPYGAGSLLQVIATRLRQPG